MRSATSYFNSTLYRKTMARFWPLWVLYGLIWLFALPLNLLNEYFDYMRWDMQDADAQAWLLEKARNIPQTLTFGVWLSCLFGVLCAMAVFGYLYNNRSACMMHALPLRRETLFVSCYLAGLSFLLLPHLAVAVLTAAAEIAFLPCGSWGAVLASLGIWLLAQSGFVLFFFSFAAFCAMFTGHSLALPAFYGVLNCLVASLYSLISALMGQFFFGYAGDIADSLLVRICTPVYNLCLASQWYTGSYTTAEDGSLSAAFTLESPSVIAAYAAAGLVFAVLALLVYQRRHVEFAGDVVSVPLVRPVFKYGVSFCSGLFFGVFTAAFFGWDDESLALSLCVIVWAAAGYFVAEMLLKKSFRVLRAWPGAVVMAVVMAALCLACFLDLFGVESRVPDAEDVASLSVNCNLSYPYDDGTYGYVELTDPSQIQVFTDLHRAIIAEKDRTEPWDDVSYISLSYTLKDGSVLSRYYGEVYLYKADLEREDSVTWNVNRLIQDRELVELSYGFDACEEGRLVEAYLYNVYNPNADYSQTIYLSDPKALWQAVRRDFDEGTIGVRYLFDDTQREENTCVADLCFNWEKGNPTSIYDTTVNLTITLTPNASHTLAVLEEMGVLENEYVLITHAERENW